jgi:hypothetical protein
MPEMKRDVVNQRPVVVPGWYGINERPIRVGLSKKQRFSVFQRDYFTCQYCGQSAPKVELEVDHINPVALGGTNDEWNLTTACYDCNRAKSARIVDRKPYRERTLFALRVAADIAFDNYLAGVGDYEHESIEDSARAIEGGSELGDFMDVIREKEDELRRLHRGESW